MRILHVLESLDFGGLERVVTDLAIAQHRRGHQVTVCCLHRTDGYKAELLAAGIEVVIAHKTGGLDLGAIRVLRRVARERRIEVVHAHSFMPNYYAAASLLALRGGPVLVGTSHDMGTRLANRQLRLLYRGSLLRTARVAMVGQQVHDRHVQMGHVPRHKAATVLNGIPVERFRLSAERRAQARAALGVDGDTLLIGAVGRLVALKNHQLLIEVLPALLARWPGLRLAIIGGGPLEAELAGRVEQLGLGAQVLLTGQRSGVADLLPALDVFAMPSLTEGLSIALLEACATGLPIVATRVGGNPEIIQDGTSGLLVPPADGAALQQALARLLESAPLRSQLGAAAERWVREHASIDAVCVAYDRLYAEARFSPAGT
ncbi:glycosyltransferase involved in cell wall biosynthesis [Sphaerotilus hippei]|uniref:Glycosyltransferase involved in cell wall biosynthesis n=1 Tax=Sphaerotilus hippei TaxID=744406 RepID=A0A318H0H1_9BURK|nr:glycosyltransferase [Sphaerotilus hippei]PXW95563.1 glycosyltransferase involved in cell wall biosynthesis [Sphaerotilus hippei]